MEIEFGIVILVVFVSISYALYSTPLNHIRDELEEIKNLKTKEEKIIVKILKEKKFKKQLAPIKKQLQDKEITYSEFDKIRKELIKERYLEILINLYDEDNEYEDYEDNIENENEDNNVDIKDKEQQEAKETTYIIIGVIVIFITIIGVIFIIAN